MIKTMEEEIVLSKSSKSIHLNLTCIATGLYFAALPFKIANGNYFLTAKNEGTKQVAISNVQGGVEVELDSEQQSINAFVSKDESSILRGVKNILTREYFVNTPSFIVGPPGTGKTSVIANAIKALSDNGKKVLLLSQTNKAIENVFERIDFSAYQEGELIAAFASESDSLQQLSPKKIAEREASPLEDLLAVANEIKNELLLKKRDMQPLLFSFEQQQEAFQTSLSNLKRDKQKLESELKEMQSVLKTIERRLFVVGKDSILNGLSKVLIGNKISALEAEQAEKIREIGLKEAEIINKNKSITLVDNNKTASMQTNSATKEAFNQVLIELKSLELKTEAILKDLNTLKMENVFKKAKVVGATLTGAALNHKIQAGKFDIVIIDEASMAIMPLLIAAEQTLNENVVDININNIQNLNEAQNKALELILHSKIVFVGDPAQLQPIAKTEELKKSVFTHYDVRQVFSGIKMSNVVLLDINYRNHPQITNIASEMFYGGLLKSSKENIDRSLYIQQSSSKMISSEGSFVNHGNMKLVVEQVKKALQRGRRDIGIITPYRKQAMLIEQNLQEANLDYPDAKLQVGTVHTFQGKEAEIIIYDLTFSPKDDDEFIPASYLGNADSDVAKMLNVAMTRASDFFIIIGDADGIKRIPQNLILKDWLIKISTLIENH